MKDSTRQHLTQAKAALRRGERTLARRIAFTIVANDPEEVEGWLLLGGLSNPKSSLAYIEKAYALAPDNPSVIKALGWARERLGFDASESISEREKKSPALKKPDRLTIPPPLTSTTHRPVWIWAFSLLLLMALFFLSIDLFPRGFVQAVEKAVPVSESNFPKPSLTPTVTNTPTPTSTPTATSTPTSTPTNTPTSTPTPTTTPTNTPIPTNTPVPTKVLPPDIPADVDRDERWIDIDLSSQRLYAYQGDELVRSFVVSTGTWQHPTPVGQFAVWIKLRYTNMSGPGYFLPDVPYTMYFYKDYGIHGTYWHNNFGTPMSHGCVNMITEEAGWLYNWSHVGILVNVHE